MGAQFERFGQQLADSFASSHRNVYQEERHSSIVYLDRPDGVTISLDLTPFEALPRKADARPFFAGIETTGRLLQAYQAARNAKPFEQDIPEAQQRVSSYANMFLNRMLDLAHKEITDHEASLISAFVAELDIYSAVKSIESLIYKISDRRLLMAARKQGWSVLFDHLAIRCGNEENWDAMRVVELLCEEHGYCQPHLSHERFYRFDTGWDAYPLYKILDNGQVLRVFVDESSRDQPQQIIQHWNHVYGFTAHHLAMRAVAVESSGIRSVPLAQIIDLMVDGGVEVLTPTGEYTEGLLLQVFTRPNKVEQVPAEIKSKLAQLNPNLEDIISNGKLIELVSREEMSPEMAQQFFALYNIRYQSDNALHSAPLFQYFLPAQAAHVINSSIQTA